MFERSSGIYRTRESFLSTFIERMKGKERLCGKTKKKEVAKDVSLFENVLAAMEKGNYRSSGIGSVRT